MVEAQQNDDSPASNQVEWTTIIYILIPLATATMTQPVGSVLGTNPISKTYLRSSPIFCLIDTIVFLFEILRHRAFYHPTFRGATRQVIQRRYRYIEDDVERLKVLKSGTVMRWVFFILGTHDCIAKLGGASNLPYTKFWGFSYIASFAVFEVMILMIPKIDSIVEVERAGAEDERRRVLSLTDCPVKLGFLAALLCSLYVLLYASLIGIISTADVVDDTNLAPWLPIFVLAPLMVIPKGLSDLVEKYPGMGENLLVLDGRTAGLIRRGDVSSWWHPLRRGSTRLSPWDWDSYFGLRMVSMIWPLVLFLANMEICLLCYRFAYDPTTTKRAT